MSRARPIALFCIALPTLAAASLLAQRTVTLSPTKDNTLYEDSRGAFSNGAGSHFFAGNNAKGQRRRGVLAFDVARALPRGARITAARLVLHMSKTSVFAPATPVSLHALTADFGEGTSKGALGEGGGGPSTKNDATWIHRFYPSTRWAAAGGDFVKTASATTTVGGVGTYSWTSMALTADVQRWLDRPATAHGWILIGRESASTTAKRFDSRENPTPSVRPRLLVTYTPPPARVTVLGRGCSGGAVAPHVLAAIGLPRIPNPSFALQASGGPAGGLQAFVFAAASLSKPFPLGNGCFVHLDPATLLTALDGGASRRMALPIPADLKLLGVEIAAQSAVAVPVTARLATSNGLVLRLGL